MNRYYVHMVDDDPVLVYGPYSLKSAKDFARIGSQPGKTGGGRRAVFDGPSADSRLIRVYEEGERVWPRSVEGLQQLEPSEVPRVLAPKPKKGSTVKFAANPAGPKETRQAMGKKDLGRRHVSWSRKGTADELATLMITNASPVLQYWLTYATFKPALVALLEQHIREPEVPFFAEKNPLSAAVFIPDRNLGVRLHNWHSGMDDPIYATGSLIYAGQPVPRELLAETIGALQSLARRTKNRGDKSELKDLAVLLISAGF